MSGSAISTTGLQKRTHPPPDSENLVEIAWPRALNIRSPADSTLVYATFYEGKCKATWEKEFKLPWREACPPNHRDDKVDSDQ